MTTVSERQMPFAGSTLLPESQVYPHSDAETTGTSPKRLARIAGVLYLLVGIFGGFAQGFLYPKIYVAGGGREDRREPG